MLDVLIALVPALAASVLIFGWRALVLAAVCVATSVFLEFVYRKCMRLDPTVSDLSAAVTGLLIALNLPAGFPIWMAVLGCLVAVILVKQLFGGIGQNFANPAIAARVFLLIAFTPRMTAWPDAKSYLPGVDAVTGATPLALIKSGAADQLPGLKNLFFGIHGGCLGETCSLALLIGLAYLLIRRVITPTIPLVYVGTVALTALALGYDPLVMILTGGVLLGGIFMLTDYATSPLTEGGKAVYALGAGILTMLIRNSAGGYPEGVSFAILLMNIAAPYLSKIGMKKPFGGVEA